MTHPTPLSYRDAGVDIDVGNQLVETIKPIAKKTHRPGVLTGLGGFGALFELPLERYTKPVLVSGTDGVGTKLKLAIELDRHDTIGIDLVAMCANDLIVCGAEPLFFLDYYATGKLSLEQGQAIIAGIGQGCEQAGAALIGGETAEMPGMYAEKDYDLAGFCVGIVEKSKIMTADKVSPGDVLIGLASSGPHSNGYSLIRKIIERSQANLSDAFGETTLGDVLLTPTRMYVKTALAVLAQFDLHAISHITGGGFYENLPRVLPEHCAAHINPNWPMPAIFEWLQAQGQVEIDEMYRTFNMGIGLVIACAADDAEAILSTLSDLNENAWVIGEVHERVDASVVINHHV